MLCAVASAHRNFGGSFLWSMALTFSKMVWLRRLATPLCPEVISTLWCSFTPENWTTVELQTSSLDSYDAPNKESP